MIGERHWMCANVRWNLSELVWTSYSVACCYIIETHILCNLTWLSRIADGVGGCALWVRLFQPLLTHKRCSCKCSLNLTALYNRHEITYSFVGYPLEGFSLPFGHSLSYMSLSEKCMRFNWLNNQFKICTFQKTDIFLTLKKWTWVLCRTHIVRLYHNPSDAAFQSYQSSQDRHEL